MATLKLNSIFKQVNGKLNKRESTIFRKKKYRAENGAVIGYGAQEAYEVLNPRDYKKNPPKGAELQNINSFADASRLTTLIIQAGKYTDDELAAMTEELREQTLQYREQLAQFKARFFAQSSDPIRKHPSSLKPTRSTIQTPPKSNTDNTAHSTHLSARCYGKKVINL